MMCQIKANFPLSPLNQRLNPLRSAPLWGQLVAQPAAAPQGPLPLWLALQPYANARLCLFEVDRPESRSPIPIRWHCPSTAPQRPSLPGCNCWCPGFFPPRCCQPGRGL
jgi:hypothetical protein